MLGLFAFFYGFLHFLTYIWLDKVFNVGEIWRDIGKRPFITVGFASFLLMVPLAVTSTAAWIRRLGGRRWELLHRLVYLIAIGGVIRYYWLVKSDIRQPALYGATLTVLLGYRLVASFGNRRVKHQKINASGCRWREMTSNARTLLILLVNKSRASGWRHNPEKVL
jgi:sulfoxide reductase heme-binding subunit YedZ